MKKCLSFLLGTGPTIFYLPDHASWQSTVPGNMLVVPAVDQWSRVQTCAPAMLCLAFGCSSLSSVFTHQAAVLPFVWVTSQPASYTS